MFAALDELIPLYPVYTLLFVDTGLSAGELSSLLALWSLTTFVLEVPFGAIADRMSRRWILAVAALIRAFGFALWITVPSYPAFAAGFLCWGATSALMSGTWEALVYDELAAAGRADRYAKLLGRTGAFEMGAVVVASALAAPLLKLGGYPLVGWVSVAVCVAAVPVVLSFPETARVATASDDPTEETAGDSPAGSYLDTLQAGLAEARTQPAVRRMLLFLAALSGLGALDEYLPLLARSTTDVTTLVPFLLLLPYAAMIVGGELAGRHPDARPRRLALTVLGGGALLVVGALSGVPVGFLGVAACFGAFRFVEVIADARLQHAITGTARATVTSVGGLSTEVVALMVYGGYALGSQWAEVPVLVAAAALPAPLLALAAARWMRPAARATRPAPTGLVHRGELAAETTT